MENDVAFLDDCLVSYTLGMSVDGDFLIPKEKSFSETDERVSRNQVKLNLKRDYIASGRTLYGKALDKMLDLFIEGKRQQVVMLVDDPKHSHLVRSYDV
jgi:hypothetical protein